MEITRTTFQLAIQAGTEAAGERLSPAEVGRLTRVGLEATTCGTNYAPKGREGYLNVGCPGSQANLSSESLHVFADAFDAYLIRALSHEAADAYVHSESVEVVS